MHIISVGELRIWKFFILNILYHCSLTKPQSFADCVGDELPVGWEQVLDINRGVYYVNHIESKLFQIFVCRIRKLFLLILQKKFKSRIRGWSGEPFRRTCCGSTWSLPRTTWPTRRSWSTSSRRGSVWPRTSSSIWTQHCQPYQTLPLAVSTLHIKGCLQNLVLLQIQKYKV